MRGGGLDQATKLKRASTISTGKGKTKLTVVNNIPRKHARILHLIPKRENTRAFHS